MPKCQHLSAVTNKKYQTNSEPLDGEGKTERDLNSKYLGRNTNKVLNLNSR